ncbi:MAG: bifunctional UDP-N-acetylglucosamine diphosphorylase/glucosamine-1-phosphate N-acetyltransferase GlmU, partial [Caldilineaceae bacterium]|nr:bifunctional UDP-N-acetylglucosamine diphosphorylase/glucosamine-1-phosphate N-acetyltransferase GlmU [Caldilineaceae bacterium]
SIDWVLQEQQLGTGHAVAQAMPHLGSTKESIVLVLCGDVPLISRASLEDQICNAGPDTLSLLTLNAPDPKGLGRIIRDRQGKVTAIVEEKDANDDQRRISEINSGIMALPAARLADWLQQLGNDNRQGEYYLTDIIAMAVAAGCQIYTRTIDDDYEVQGVNDKVQLSRLERHYQRRIAEQLMKEGVTMADPGRIDVRGNLTCGRDVVVDVNVIFEGQVSLGDNVHIGPNVTIKDATLGNDTVILANTVIESATIADQCTVGPFARLRPGTLLSDGVKVGNFVEIKNSTLGRGSKANHFAYIGDADLGESVNVGAGTIFCNYDGVNKHRCHIGNNVFIGSNSTLVAPVNISAGAFVAAGSTINADVPENDLAIGRGKQRNISGWKRPTRKQ